MIFFSETRLRPQTDPSDRTLHCAMCKTVEWVHLQHRAHNFEHTSFGLACKTCFAWHLAFTKSSNSKEQPIFQGPNQNSKRTTDLGNTVMQELGSLTKFRRNRDSTTLYSTVFILDKLFMHFCFVQRRVQRRAPPPAMRQR